MSCRRALRLPDQVPRTGAQVELLDLTAAGHRELFDEEDVARDFETGDLAMTELDHLVSAQLRPGFRLNKRDAHLTQAWLRRGDDLGHEDLRVTIQQCLNLGCRN